MTEFHNLLYERWLQVGTSKNNLAHTFTYFANFRGFDNLLFWKCHTFQVDAMHMLVKTLCTCSCGMVLMMHVRMTWLPICVNDCKAIKGRERVCVTSCYLTTKVPSAPLVAVGWLQHTRYPRFRRGTFDYGVATSPNKRGRVGVQSFMWMHVSISMLPECICYAGHVQKQHFN
jgi:hypothetical protein